MLRFLVVAVAFWLAMPCDIAAQEPNLQGLPALRLTPAQIPIKIGRRKTKINVPTALSLAAFAAIVAPKLARIEAEFRERRQGLTVVSAGTESAAYHTDEVERLVDSTEKRLLETLDPKDLAPLRDSIRLRFRHIRNELNASSQTGRLHGPASAMQTGIRRAAFGGEKSGLGGFLLRTVVEPLLNTTEAVVSTVKSLAEEKRFTARLCVVSRPESGASFRMWPPEYSEGGFSGETNQEIRQAVLGYYFYKVQYKQRALKKRFAPIECGGGKGSEDADCLDLWESTGDQLIACDFEKQSCRPLPGPCRSQ